MCDLTHVDQIPLLLTADKHRVAYVHEQHLKGKKMGGERENKKENKITQNSSFYFVYPFKKHSYYFQPELAAFGHGSEHTWGVLWTTKQVWIIKEEFSRKQEDELGRGQHYQPGFVMGTLPKLEASTTQLLDKNNTSLTAK